MSILSVLRLPPTAYSAFLYAMQPLAAQFFQELYSEYFAVEEFSLAQAHSLSQKVDSQGLLYRVLQGAGESFKTFALLWQAYYAMTGHPLDPTIVHQRGPNSKTNTIWGQET